mgnify:CR=1 FL=1
MIYFLIPISQICRIQRKNNILHHLHISVKKGRGIKNVDYSQVTSEEEFINMIVSDARREFVGEGQTFFMYKRLKKNLLGMELNRSSTLPILPTDHQTGLKILSVTEIIALVNLAVPSLKI